MTHLGKLVQVEWEDSYGCSPHWENLKDAKCSPCTAMSVGWVFGENEKAILLVPHRVDGDGKGDEQGCGDMVIPRSCILSIRELMPRSESKDETIPAAQHTD